MIKGILKEKLFRDIITHSFSFVNEKYSTKKGFYHLQNLGRLFSSY